MCLCACGMGWLAGGRMEGGGRLFGRQATPGRSACTVIPASSSRRIADWICPCMLSLPCQNVYPASIAAVRPLTGHSTTRSHKHTSELVKTRPGAPSVVGRATFVPKAKRQEMQRNRASRSPIPATQKGMPCRQAG